MSHVLDGRTFGDVAGFDASARGGVGGDAIAAYKRDGVICLRGAFGQDWLDVIESGIDEAMDKPGPSAAMIGLPGDRGSFLAYPVNAHTHYM